ncbi:MAG: uracil-xanthine permease [Lachnospiraceae bacterium]|nr:uracil-xanthine permease [Lachnospiraceae bacterium]
MGKKTDSQEAIFDARELGTGRVLILGVQHMFAMFGATVLVPLLTGLSVSSTLLFAGLGTLLFHLISKKKVPAFLGSSFAFLAGYAAIAPNGEPELLPYACFGVAVAGFMYLILAVLFKVYGASRVIKFFPPVVTGPIIIAIGLNLAQSAIENCSSNWGIALVAIFIVIICNIWGKGMIKIIPILLGVIGSYLVAAVTGNIDFTPVSEAAWIGFPVSYERTVFSLFTGQGTDGALLLSAVITIVPISLATMLEHIGDISAISSTVGKNFIQDPGLHRTLTGDGLATTIAALFGAPANTTYGENTGVLTLTKVFDPMVIRRAAIMAILFSFCPKFASVIEVMPQATIGGISLVLYGMISAVGIRNVVEIELDFSKSRNVIIAGLILVLSIGIHYSGAGALVFNLGSATISLSGLATGSLVGIILNAILPES